MITIKLITIPMMTRRDKREISFHDKFEILPIDQKVNFCNFSAEVKYDKTETIALVKLPNINPTIRIAIVSFNFWETNKTAIQTKKLPKLEANTNP